MVEQMVSQSVELRAVRLAVTMVELTVVYLVFLSVDD